MQFAYKGILIFTLLSLFVLIIIWNSNNKNTMYQGRKRPQIRRKRGTFGDRESKRERERVCVSERERESIEVLSY